MKTQPLTYSHGTTQLEGYLAYDEAITNTRPAVLVVHEWKGLNDYARKRAEQLAMLGYVGFAVDMYGKGVLAKDNAEAQNLMMPLVTDRALCRRRVRAAYDVVSKLPQVAANRMAIIGYCFGGLTALELARSGVDLRAAVSFHGNLSTVSPLDAKNIKAKVLACHGADDPLVPPDQVRAFEKEMRDAKVDWQLVAYGNTVHSFTFPGAGNDPTTGLAYNPAADKRSWDHMKLWLADAFN